MFYFNWKFQVWVYYSGLEFRCTVTQDELFGELCFLSVARNKVIMYGFFKGKVFPYHLSCTVFNLCHVLKLIPEVWVVVKFWRALTSLGFIACWLIVYPYFPFHWILHCFHKRCDWCLLHCLVSVRFFKKLPVLPVYWVCIFSL